MLSAKSSFGAIVRSTGSFVTASAATKDLEYDCPDCAKTVILCKGTIRMHYFRHNGHNNCEYYDKPSESQVHKEAKFRMQMQLLNRGEPTLFLRNCNSCLTEESTEIHVNSNCDVRLEHRFEYNKTTKIADVAIVDNETNKIIAIVEICHTHRTRENDRPSSIPWFEVDATSFVRLHQQREKTEAAVDAQYEVAGHTQAQSEPKKTEAKFDTETEAEPEADEAKMFIVRCMRNSCMFQDRHFFQFGALHISINFLLFHTNAIIARWDGGEDGGEDGGGFLKFSMCTKLRVDCNNNFNEEEKDFIRRIGIRNIEHILRSDDNVINLRDKQRAMKCYKYVLFRVDLTGIEPANGNVLIQVGKYVFSLRFSPDGKVTFIQSQGEKNLASDFVCFQLQGFD